jgi:hypothetical protein
MRPFGERAECLKRSRGKPPKKLRNVPLGGFALPINKTFDSATDGHVIDAALYIA